MTNAAAHKPVVLAALLVSAVFLIASTVKTGFLFSSYQPNAYPEWMDIFNKNKASRQPIERDTLIILAVVSAIQTAWALLVLIGQMLAGKVNGSPTFSMFACFLSFVADLATGILAATLHGFPEPYRSPVAPLCGLSALCALYLMVQYRKARREMSLEHGAAAKA
ncbi:hypothetical protein H9P43_004957 [Blastocladiella emersonii ATCC 22665]|nr:hypothetical protein H9P43_004957 [Blastocladiella emersonii ATCC 22665]